MEVGKMKAPDELIGELLQRYRLVLYQGKPDKVWYAQQQMVKKALLYPAAWLGKRQVEIPAERYRAIMEGILATMAANGNLGQVTWVSRYVLHCVQQHMEHHGEEYYCEGVAIRNRVSMVMDRIEKAARGADGTVPILAEADKLLRIGKRKVKIKVAAPALQADLFGDSKPGKVANSN
jgi:hypothetical protein